MNQRLQPKAPSVPSFTPTPGGVLQRKRMSAGLRDEGDSAVPPIVHDVLRSPGQPLDPDLRSSFEPRFGHDFGNVRVHTDARAVESARAVNALAYAIGPNIVLQPDHYEPASVEGKKLLAHELTHVLQQTSAGGTHASEEAAEKEANRNAATSEGNSNFAVEIAAPGKLLQRQPATEDAGPAAALTDVEKAVRAAERARREPTNATMMMIRGSEIVYRLIHEFLPDYDSKISGVSYRASLKEVDVQAANGTISITVGNDFILGMDQKTVELRALDLGRAIFAKAPRPAPTKRLPGLLGSMAIESKKAPVKDPDSQNQVPAPPVLLVETTFGYEVPGLGPEKTSKVEELIKTKDAKKIQEAVNLIVQYGGGPAGSNIDSSLLVDRKMEYDPTITSEDAVSEMPRWDYIKNKAEPRKVRIGQNSFSSVPYLYSVIMHEYQHVLWNQSLKNQEIGRETHEEGRQGGGMYTSEVEAYAWELLHAEESGLFKIPEKIAGVWRNLNDEFWIMEPAAQAKMRPMVQRAWTAANRFVKGTTVTLDPFKKP
jgi:hypothetical protein